MKQTKIMSASKEIIKGIGYNNVCLLYEYQIFLRMRTLPGETTVKDCESSFE